MPLTIAVLDVGGNLVLLKRQDGSGNLRADIAIGKAWGALGMGISSRTIRDRLKDRPAFQGALAAARMAASSRCPAACWRSTRRAR